MAFNPFNWFRKHQKMLIAIVTIFVMFIFIAQFGQGDLFQKIGNWFGARGRGARGDVVASVHGTKYREQELQLIGAKRKLASDFIFYQAWDSHPKVLSELAKELKPDFKADKPNLTMDLFQICERAQKRFLERRTPPQFMLDQIVADLRTLHNLSEGRMREKTESLVVIQKLATVLGYHAWILQHGLRAAGVPNDLIFGGNSNKMDDLLDFVMFEQQADKLGIKLTDADIAQEINRECAGHEIFDVKAVHFETDKTVQTFLNTYQDKNVTARDLIEGLRKEFRVVIALNLLLGSEAGARTRENLNPPPGVRAFRGLFGTSTSPAVITPDEFLKFFREYRTTMKVQMLAVPAEKFLDQVKEKPTEDELQARFEKYRDQESSPISPDPGFKLSRRILVEYLVGDPDSKYFRDLAHYTIHPATRLMGRMGSAANTTIVGAGPLGPAMAILLPVVADPLQQEYEAYLNDQLPWLPIYGDFRPESPNHEQLQRRFRQSSLNEPQVGLSAILGGGGPAGPLNALGSMLLTASVPETRDAVRQTVGVLLSSSNPQDAIGTAALALATQPRTRSLPEVAPALLATLERRTAHSLLRTQFEDVTREFQKHKRDAKEAEKYLAQELKKVEEWEKNQPEVLKKRIEDAEKRLKELKKPEDIKQLEGEIANLKESAKHLPEELKKRPALKRYSMPGPRSAEAMYDELERKVDLNLKTLQDLRTRQLPFFGTSNAHTVQSFFRSQGPYETEASTMFKGGDDSDFDRVEFMWWRKEDLPVERREYAKAEEDVKRAWKMERARYLAQKKADELVSQINSKKNWSPADVKRFLNEQKGLGTLFELENVALLVPPQEVHLIREGEYLPYTVPQDKRLLLPYPPANMVSQLLSVSRLGEAVTIGDIPQKTFYVSVLEERSEPTVGQFAEMYSRPPMRDMIYTRYVETRAVAYRKAAVEQMRREAGKVDREGRWEIPEDIRKRDSRQDGEPQ